MERAKKLASNALSWLLAVTLVFGWGGVFSNSPFGEKAYALDVGANPEPKVDIAVAVPADYPGTFLDFKAELTEKLVALGMSPSDFRITDTATKIDTTDQSTWVVYDHYYNQAQYNALGYTAEQQKTHPYRAADNSKTTGGIIPMSDIFAGGGTVSTCRNFITHTYSYEEDGKANMVFAGYGTNALVDYMFYPATSNARRTVSFDLDATVIDKHTLQGAGFLLNAGVDANGILQGYAFYIIPQGSNKNIQQIAKAYIYKLNNFNAMSTTSVGGTQIAACDIDLGAAKKLRISIDLQETKVTVQSQPYDASGNLIGLTPTNNFVNIPLDKNGYNGFGPIVGYTSHGCSSLTVFKYLDLEMAFESSAFDSLKTVQYYQGAEQKYFINLVGDSGDTGIPDPTGEGENAETDKKMFEDGINRMTENKTFYLSNMDDGHVLQNTDKEAGVQGLGTSNGFIASGDSHVDLMAQYIYQNFLEGAQFQPEPVLSAIPLSNFYLKDVATDKQLMTVHLQHLENGGYVSTKIEGGSIPGTSAGDDGYIKYRHLTVTDPNGTTVFDSGWVDDRDTDSLNKLLEGFHFTKESIPGRYEFHMQVRDDKWADNDPTSEALHQSTEFTTYITAFNDTDYPIITGANTHENVATITLTDTGQGIDEDGITFIEDNRGSGVIAYFATTDPNLRLTSDSDEWIRLPFAQHSISFDYVMTSTEPLYVWSMDECGNIGYKGGEDDEDQPDLPAVFQPTRVVVEDPNGDVIKEYYVIGDKPIIVLPDDTEVPEHPDDPENEHFSGWQTPEGTDVTPGDETGPSKPIVPDENNTIVIRPAYSHDTATLVYLANGGKITTSTGSQVDSSPYQVVSGSSILKKISDHDVSASQKGYTFTGWKLLNTDDAAKAADVSYISNPANVEEVTNQLAKLITEPAAVEGDPDTVIRDTYYLVAQWEPGNYTVHFDANGGTLKGLNKIENVSYDTNLAADDISQNVGTQTIPVDGRQIPVRAGYNFAGWSTVPTTPVDDNDPDRATKLSAVLFKAAAGYTAGAEVPTMPDQDVTVYAVWERDTSLLLVNFDANGGSSVASVSYSSAETTYKAALKSNYQGYTFGGWYLEERDGNGDPVFNEDALYPETGTPIDKSNGDLTYVAKWIPNETTKYTIDYFVNSGNKDADGNYIYTKVNTVKEGFDSLRVEDPENPGVYRPHTLTMYAPTDSHVSIPNSTDAYLADITTNGTSYWLNRDNPSTRVEGDVAGNGSLSLRLYYDRYLNINVSKSNYSTGNGTVTSALRQHEGTRPTVTWAPDANSYVARVTVNGVIRDDLLNAGSYTPAQGIESNETVIVEFAKKTAAGSTPSDPNPPVDPSDPTVEPDPDDVVVDPRTFVVSTAVYGCTDDCAITGTKIYKAGENAVVSWDICDKSTLLRVELDGQPIELDKDATSLTLQGLAQNHTVEVYVTPATKPSIGAVRENGFYTITVNRYGGDSKFITSTTRKIPVDDYAELVAKINAATGDEKAQLQAQLNKLWTFEWDRADSDYRIYNVRVNGNRQKDLPNMIPDEGSFLMTPGAGYIVDVYFYDIVTTPTNPNDPDDPDNPEGGENIEYKEPDLSRVDEWVSVKTTILGGAGSIDPSFVAKKDAVGDTHDVTYTLENSTDKDAPDYMYYEVEEVTVNGQVVTDYQTMTDGGKITIPLKLDGSVKDNDVVVKVKPLFVEVETSKVTLEADENGVAKLASANVGGSISASRTVGKYGNYYDIKAQPAAGYRLYAIEVTDDATGAKETHYALTDEDGTITSVTTEKPESSAPDTADDEAEGADEPATAAVEADEAADDAAADADTVSDATILSTTAEVGVYMMGVLHPENTFAQESGEGEGEGSDAAADLADQGEATAPEADGAEGEAADDAAADAADQPESFASESVQMMAPASDTQDEPAAQPEGLFAPEMAYADEADGSQPAVDSFRTPQVSDGNTVTLGYGNMSADKHVNAIFVRTDVKDDASIDKVVEEVNDPTSPNVHNVTLSFSYEPSYVGQNVRPELKNDDGSIADDGTGKVANGGSTTVRWGNLANYQVADVKVNGVSVGHDPNSIELSNITGNTHVEVVLQRQTRNQPDTVNPTGFDPKYTVTTKVTGYGGLTISPTKTVVAGSSYTVAWEPTAPTVNAEGQELNIPYIQSFKVDGQEMPEYVGRAASGQLDFTNIDSNKSVEIHTIMMNEDVNGDGKPDYNIDTDGDDEPDLNKDTDGDGLPDVDVDTDGDGKPDVNIDTDGDGKPDINIVDKDTDGHPENVDPLKPADEQPKPNVNVDTDGDGKPDVNIVDKDGDGKPDPVDPKNPEKPTVNVDTNGDGVPDLFIDVDGDNIPDVNIDTDGDGKPDINVDTDGDLVPDVNIDTDGTDSWKPSSEGGNADKIWKPYLNIDINDGKGPVHTDSTDPIDENGDGVDDRWVPSTDTKADNGFAYDTLGENWVNDQEPGENPGTPVNPDDPDNPDKKDPTKLPSPSDPSQGGANGETGSNSGKVNGAALSSTGDTTLFAASVLAMVAYTGLVVLFLASRRMRAERKMAKAGRHAR